MHMRLGLPLTSAEQDPHFPALQFQRTARSGAWRACTSSTASRTTIPVATSVVYSCSAPPRAPPRQILRVTLALIASSPRSSHLLDDAAQLRWDFRERLAPQLR